MLRYPEILSLPFDIPPPSSLQIPIPSQTSPLTPPSPLSSPLTLLLPQSTLLSPLLPHSSLLWPLPCLWTDPSDVACWLAVAGLVKDVFESPAGQDAVGAVSDYLRTQRVTSLPDLQVCPTHNHLQQSCSPWQHCGPGFCPFPVKKNEREKHLSKRYQTLFREKLVRNNN